jgi:hypothetical protein
VSGRHRFAFFGAAFASVRTPLAMIRFMLAAFLAARLTDLSAQAAKLLRELRIARHKLRRKHANVRAIPIQPDATGHHLNILFLQASGRAMFAFLRALQARFNAASVFVVSHRSSFSFEGCSSSS